jgi:hypothetical protein
MVSRDFGILCLRSLERFGGRDRDGSGLFFILMTFSYLILCQHLPPEEWLFRRELPDHELGIP